MVQVDECSWMIEAPGLLHIELVKDPAGTDADTDGEGDDSVAWWRAVLVGEPEVSVAAALPTGDVADMSPAQRARFARALADGSAGSSVGTTTSDGEPNAAMEEGQRQLIEEMQKRKDAERRALENPKKREMLLAMREKFPDVNIEIR